MAIGAYRPIASLNALSAPLWIPLYLVVFRCKIKAADVGSHQLLFPTLHIWDEFQNDMKHKKGPHRNAAPSLGIGLARLEFLKNRVLDGIEITQSSPVHNIGRTPTSHQR